MRPTVLLAATLLLLPRAVLAASDVPRDYLDAHCVTCHAGATPAGGLDLESLTARHDDPATAARWVRVHDRVRDGEMPPAKRPRPPAADTATFLGTLARDLAAPELKRRTTHGRAPMRRLSRTEYETTLRDLLDLPGLSVKDLLPEDGRAFGYDKTSAALDLSPVLLAKYLEAADAALDAAIARTVAPPPPVEVRMSAHEQYDFGVVIPNGDGVMLKDLKYDDSRFPLPRDGYAGGKYRDLGELERSGVWKDKPGTAGLFRCLGESFAGRFNRFSPTAAGRYRVSTSVWSFWWDKGEVKPAPRTGAAGLYYGGRVLGFFDAPSLTPTTHEVVTWLEPGEYLKFDPASLWETHVYHRKGRAAEFVGPGVAIDYLEVEGPLNDVWPPASHQCLFGDLPLTPFDKLPRGTLKPARSDQKQLTRDAQNPPPRLAFATVHPSDPAASANRLLSEFLPRAFRRPVPPAEAARYAALAQARLADGSGFEDAMRAVYKAALCSPDFLFLQASAGPLEDYALASRLSYFLTDSTPDDALLAAAKAGTLHDAAGLKSQAERLLSTPQADRFLTDFADQWLDLRDFDATTPDRQLYPEFNPLLRDAIRREPVETLRKQLRENRPVTALVKTDFLTLNQRLAEHYGVPGVTGTAFRDVPLPPGTGRGGLLTAAAVLKVTANGTTTSPVKRGAWVRRKLLGKPPQPPPPGTPAVEPDVRGATTIRDQLAKHRDNASCAACHAAIDPPGFALESFDPIGGRRDRYRSTEKGTPADTVALFPSHLSPAKTFPADIYHVGFRSGPPVDASGTLADGRAFAGIDQFRDLLAADPRQLARNFVNQLVTYGTGAPVSFADRAEVEAILDRSNPVAGYPLRTLVVETVLSPLFRHK